MKKRRIVESLDMKGALLDSLLKLSPKEQLKNPVMFVVFLGAIISTFICFQEVLTLSGSAAPFPKFDLQIALWLWFTVLFANFAEGVAERKGKAQAASLKKGKHEIVAKLLKGNGSEMEAVAANQLKKGDIYLCEVGDIIPADGEIIDGIASVDESAITGESAPVIREAGGDRSGVMAGTKLVSDSIKVRVTSNPGESYLDKMISLIEGAKRRPTPNEAALNILLVALTLLFLVAMASLKAFIIYSSKQTSAVYTSEGDHVSLIILLSLLVCLIPTTIGGLLSAVGISGMERLLRKNVLAMSGKAVEMAGDVDVLLLDKTGTITMGTRMAFQLTADQRVLEEELASATLLASSDDQTPEGRSIVQFIFNKFKLAPANVKKEQMTFIPFTAETRMSGVNYNEADGETGISRSFEIRKGAVDSIKKFVEGQGGSVSAFMIGKANEIAREGGTPLMVAVGPKILGTIYLKDIIKSGIRERFAQLRQMGIRTVMVTGDNPLTASTIAAEAGVDDFIAEATPEAKLKRIVHEQEAGHLVAMIGDGTNDAPALAQADVGVAMNSGTQAAKEASNMVDLDSDPTKLLEIVETGKELLMTRGALTTFSVANDVAKYFTILPAVLSGLYVVKGKSVFAALDILHLAGPQSAILSAVIFNALVIVALVPLALKGVKCKPMSSSAMLRRNVFIYGLGGLVAPFIGIKVIDMIISFLHFV